MACFLPFISCRWPRRLEINLINPSAVESQVTQGGRSICGSLTQCLSSGCSGLFPVHLWKPAPIVDCPHHEKFFLISRSHTQGSHLAFSLCAFVPILKSGHSLKPILRPYLHFYTSFVIKVVIEWDLVTNGGEHGAVGSKSLCQQEGEAKSALRAAGESQLMPRASPQ